MPQPPNYMAQPIPQLLWPAFRDGDLSLNTETVLDLDNDWSAWRTHRRPKAAFNLGMKMGLTGHTSLAPLIIVWTLCAAALGVGIRQAKGELSAIHPSPGVRV